MFKLVLDKAEEPETKLPTSAGLWKNKEKKKNKKQKTKEGQRRTLHTNQGFNPRRRYNNYKFICA